MILFLSFFIVSYWIIKISCRSQIEIKKQRGINSLLETRVSTPIPLTSIPRRSNYGICNLSLRNSPAKRGQVEIGFQGQQQVLSDYYMPFVFIFFSFVRLFWFNYNLSHYNKLIHSRIKSVTA